MSKKSKKKKIVLPRRDWAEWEVKPGTKILPKKKVYKRQDEKVKLKKIILQEEESE